MTRELAAKYPHEMCILHRLIIVGFSGPTCALVSLNALLLRELWPQHAGLACWCSLRIGLCLIRPYLWWRVMRVYGDARAQATPALVAQAFIVAQDNPNVRLNGRLGVGFIAWLCCSAAYLLMRGLSEEGRDDVEQALWRHCKLNFCSLLVQKLLSIALFFYLINSDRVLRNMLPATLEAYSTVHTLDQSDVDAAGSASLSDAQQHPQARRVLCTTECIICVREFAAGERVRWLQCPHAFHVECIDEWALQHKNQCPLCGLRIGPPEPTLAQLRGDTRPHAD